MATNELTSRGSSSWLNRWWLPFLWIILTPIVTVPLSALLFSLLANYHEAYEVGLPSKAVPGWFSGEPTYPYRYFAVAPTVMAFTLPGLTNLAGTSYFEYDASWTFGYSTPHSEIWFFGVLAWLGTLLAWALFEPVWGLFGWLSHGLTQRKEGL